MSAEPLKRLSTPAVPVPVRGAASPLDEWTTLDVSVSHADLPVVVAHRAGRSPLLASLQALAGSAPTSLCTPARVREAAAP